MKTTFGLPEKKFFGHIESAIGRDLKPTERRALRNRDATMDAIRDVPANQAPAAKGKNLSRGGTTSGSPGQLVRYWNKWRENYNALVGLTISRVRSLNEMTQRGDHAYPQWTYRTIERRHPVLKALIDCCEEPIENFKWDVRVKAALPASFTEAQATAQQDALKAAYAQIDNIQEAITHVTHADFRGYAFLNKHRVSGAFDDSGELKPQYQYLGYLADRDPESVYHLECLFSFTLCRDGLFGDWFWNPDSKSLTAPEFALGNANRIGGDTLLREDFIIREVERPIDEIALENYVRRKLIEKDWSAFDEIFGIPSGVVIMPPGIEPGKEADYEASAKAIAEGGSGAMPHGSDYKPNETPRDGSALFKNHLDQLNEDLVLAGTGGKLTMLVSHGGGKGGGGGQARGSAQTQADVFWQIMFGRASKSAQTFHRDFDIPFLAEKFPGQPPLVEFRIITEEETDITQVCANIGAVATVMQPDVDWFNELTGYEMTLKPVTPPPAPGENNLPPENNPKLKNRDSSLLTPSSSLDLGSTLHEMILPILKRLEAIAAVDDAGIQQHMIEKLLKDFPQISAAIGADNSLAKKLSPMLGQNLIDGLKGRIHNRFSLHNVGDLPGHEFHGNQWTKVGGKMSGGDLRRRIRKETGMGNDEAKQLVTNLKLHQGDNVVHKHDDVERVRQEVEKIKSGAAPVPESKEPSAIAQRLFLDGKKTYGLESKPARFTERGYVHEGVVSDGFKKDWETDSSALRSEGWSRYENNWGQDIMQHTVPHGNLTDREGKML